MTELKSKVNSLFYKKILKRILFHLDPELVHNLFINFGEILGSNILARKLTSIQFDYKNKILEQEVMGIKLRNPIGLAAGFDYNGRLTQILPSIGFGIESIGSVTYNSYEGNPKPRLKRLPKSLSLLVNKGLKNEGIKKIIKSLKELSFDIPIGISVAKTNSKETADEKGAIKDYVSSLKLLEKSNLGSYYEINISCPNAFGGEPFTTPKRLQNLLKEIDKLKIKKPTLIKMPIDLETKEIIALCEIAKEHNIQGLIFGNLTKNRDNPIFNKEEISSAGKGSFSGKPTEKRSNELISLLYKRYKKRFTIVGCGGIFSAQDAYEKIKLGASFVQMITGMIYNGPNVISEINHGLVYLLKKDGFHKISEAIGAKSN